MNQIELPTPISPCLRIFIEVLLNEDNRDFGETTNLKTSAPTPNTTPKRATSARQEWSRSRLRLVGCLEERGLTTYPTTVNGAVAQQILVAGGGLALNSSGPSSTEKL